MKGAFRIIFCILACACLCAAVPVGAFFGLLPCLFLLLGAALSAFLMFRFAKEPPQKKADYMDNTDNSGEQPPSAPKQ